MNGEAIYSTTASPFARLPWGRCTKKVAGDDTTLYLHVFQWPANGKLAVPGLKATVEKAWLLADSHKNALATEASAEDLIISVPASASNPISTTVVLKLKGKIEIEPSTINQDLDGSLKLAAAEARLHGDGLQYESGDAHDNIGYWLNPGDWVDWEFKVAKPGKFTVTAEVAAQEPASFTVALGSQKLKASSKATGGYTRFETIPIGTIELTETGKTTLSVRPVKDGWQPLNLRSVRFKPAP